MFDSFLSVYICVCSGYYLFSKFKSGKSNKKNMTGMAYNMIYPTCYLTLQWLVIKASLVINPYDLSDSQSMLISSPPQASSYNIFQLTFWKKFFSSTSKYLMARTWQLMTSTNGIFANFFTGYEKTQNILDQQFK